MQRPKLFEKIMSILSTKSDQKLRASAQFAEINKRKDPLNLCKLLKEIHLVTQSRIKVADHSLPTDINIAPTARSELTVVLLTILYWLTIAITASTVSGYLCTPRIALL